MSIGAQASERAAEVGHGRVGRTKKLAMEERAALAARALIRHLYTDYEEKLPSEVGTTVPIPQPEGKLPRSRSTSSSKRTALPSPAEPPAGVSAFS